MVMVKTYQKYKDSKLTWLEKVPEGWQILRGKTVFRCIDMRSKDGSEELLSVSSKDGVVPRSSKKITMFMAESYAGYKLCWPGDLVVNSLWAWMFGLGFSRHHGIVSSAYGVYRTRSQYLDHWQYFDYLIRSKAYAWELRVRSRGVWTSRLQMTDDRFLDMPILVPPKEEAIEIEKFLSVLDIQIRRCIREKLKVIKLLNEQKQSMVDRAITRGVNPNARFKSSGVDWLGDIPEHWEVNKLKRIVYFAPSRSESGFSKDSKELVVFLPMERVSHDGQIDCSELRPVSEVWQGYTYFRRDDVVIAKITPCFENGKGACLDQLKSEFGFGTSEFIVLRAKENEVYPRYLYLITTTRMFRIFGSEAMTGAAGQQRVSSAFVKNFMVPLPPKDEQEAIIKVIHEQSAKYDLIIRQAKDEIDLLREYRFRLISDVVTGKIDVRDVKLPEIEDVPNSDPIEDQETLEDVEDTEEVVNADE